MIATQAQIPLANPADDRAVSQPASHIDPALLVAILGGTPIAQLCDSQHLSLADLIAWFRSEQIQSLYAGYFDLLAVQQQAAESALLAKALTKLEALCTSAESQSEQRKAAADLVRSLRNKHDNRARRSAGNPNSSDSARAVRATPPLQPRAHAQHFQSQPVSPPILQSTAQSISKIPRPPDPQPQSDESVVPTLSQIRLDRFIATTDAARGISHTQTTHFPIPAPKLLQTIIPKLEGLNCDPFLPESEVRALHPEVDPTALPIMRRLMQEDTVLQGARALLNHGTYRQLPAVQAVQYVREFLQNRVNQSPLAPNADPHPPPASG